MKDLPPLEEEEMLSYSRRLERAEAKVLIYKSACSKAYNILTTVRDRPEFLQHEAIKVLKGAYAQAAEVDSWVTLGSIADGVLFELRLGRRYVKTSDRHIAGIICIPLNTGVREELDSQVLVRCLTIKEE